MDRRSLLLLSAGALLTACAPARPTSSAPASQAPSSVASSSAPSAPASTAASTPGSGRTIAPTEPAGAPVEFRAVAFGLSLQAAGSGETDYETDPSGALHHMADALHLLWLPPARPIVAENANGRHGRWHTAEETKQKVTSTTLPLGRLDLVELPFVNHKNGTQDTYTDVLAFFTWNNPPIAEQKTICLAWWESSATAAYARRVVESIKPL